MSTLSKQKKTAEEHGKNYLTITKFGETEKGLYEVTFMMPSTQNYTKKLIQVYLGNCTKAEGKDGLKIVDPTWIIWEKYNLIKKESEVLDIILKHFKIKDNE